jgi:hypothetical protein
MMPLVDPGMIAWPRISYPPEPSAQKIPPESTLVAPFGAISVFFETNSLHVCNRKMSTPFYLPGISELLMVAL